MSKLFGAPSLPGHWVAEESGELLMFPALADGWSKRTPYRGHRRALAAVPAYNALGTGWPGAERERVEKGAVEARYLLRLPATLDASVRRAAEAEGVSLADWWRLAATERLKW